MHSLYTDAGSRYSRSRSKWSKSLGAGSGQNFLTYSDIFQTVYLSVFSRAPLLNPLISSGSQQPSITGELNAHQGETRINSALEL